MGAVVSLAACGGGSQVAELRLELKSSNASPLRAGPGVGAVPRFFSSSSFWNEPVPVAARIDRSSSAAVAALVDEVVAEQRRAGGPWINTTSYSVPIYAVSARQPLVRVSLGRRSPALQAAFDAVPLPPDARAARGTDEHLLVVQPATHHLWEFWHLRKTSRGWSAAWGGAMSDEATDSGAYERRAWPGAQPWWGASASSLSIAGGLITLGDLRRGVIDHGLAMPVPDVRAGSYVWPAGRTDGTAISPSALPEGAHLRLSPDLDLKALHLPYPTMLLAQAAQRYGIFIRDKAAEITFYAQDPANTGYEPYLGTHGYFLGLSPGQLLAAFPWNHLQLLQMRLHKQKDSHRG